jgi:hypothetical protein
VLPTIIAKECGIFAVNVMTVSARTKAYAQLFLLGRSWAIPKRLAVTYVGLEEYMTVKW